MKEATSGSSEAREQFLRSLRARFDRHPGRHRGLNWAEIEARLKKSENSLRSLQAMEMSGGEPDVVGVDDRTGEYLFFDCCEESPKGRRSLCYDRAALDARKENRPADSAIDVAAAMGIALLTEAEYRALQELGEFDRRTSSWVQTPPEMRKLGGALFCDRRFGRVFTYHNGAESYYAGRGFRGSLRV